MSKQHGKRGKTLEQLVIQANEVYLEQGIALISKVPNDWSIIRSYNAFTRRSEITGAFPKKTIIDFIGIYQQRCIAFDCKECHSTTSFPLSNIHDHQSNYLSMMRDLGGRAFYIVYFVAADRIFILTQTQLEKFIVENNRKSIPFSYFEQSTKEIQLSWTFLNYLDYLEE